MAADDRQSLDSLLPVVYQELRRLAANYLRRERPGQTLQPTGLVHEAYLRLMKDRPDRWQNRAHFCAIAAHSMRQILIERARARGALKRGGVQARVTLDEALVVGPAASAPSTSSPSTMPSRNWRHSIPNRLAWWNCGSSAA